MVGTGLSIKVIDFYFVFRILSQFDAGSEHGTRDTYKTKEKYAIKA